ncbi:MAG TPA: hypothetical protein VFA45_20220 [Actinomycetes bacterium]|nr:hypothetical protein [Actinomycetes bacterium]
MAQKVAWKGVVQRWMQDAVSGLLDEDEGVVAALPVRWSTTPLPYFFIIRGYYLVLTTRRLLFLAHARWSSKPGRLAFLLPRARDVLSGYGEDAGGATLWIRSPDRGELRFAVHPRWMDEARMVAEALKTTEYEG